MNYFAMIWVLFAVDYFEGDITDTASADFETGIECVFHLGKLGQYAEEAGFVIDGPVVNELGYITFVVGDIENGSVASCHEETRT